MHGLKIDCAYDYQMKSGVKRHFNITSEIDRNVFVAKPISDKFARSCEVILKKVEDSELFDNEQAVLSHLKKNISLSFEYYGSIDDHLVMEHLTGHNLSYIIKHI